MLRRIASTTDITKLISKERDDDDYRYSESDTDSTSSSTSDSTSESDSEPDEDNKPLTLTRTPPNFQSAKKTISKNLAAFILITKQKIEKMEQSAHPSFRHLFFVRKIIQIKTGQGNQQQDEQLTEMEEQINNLMKSNYGVK